MIILKFLKIKLSMKKKFIVKTIKRIHKYIEISKNNNISEKYSKMYIYK